MPSQPTAAAKRPLASAEPEVRSATTAIEDPRRRLVVMTGVCAALAAVQTSVAALNVAIPQIGAEFGASQGALLWVVNGFTLTLAALLLPLGALGDRVGRKPMLVIGLIVFGLAGFGASQATSVEMLIALRVIAGIGGAMVLPATLSVITSSFPPESKSTAIGVWAGVAGSGGGGLLGLIGASFVVDAVTWRWIFALILVPAALALVLVVAAVPNSVEGQGQRFDYIGAVLSSAAIGGLVLGTQEGPEHGWSAPLTVAGLGVGVVAAVAWIIASARVVNPLLDLRLFRYPVLDVDRVAALYSRARLTMRAQPALTDLAHETRIGPRVTERDDLVEQRRRPQMRIIDETRPDVDLEVGQRVERDGDPNTGLAVAVQIRADRLAVPFQMASDGRDRPAPFLQRVSFHIFSLCEHGERGSFDLVGVRTASVEGAPPRLVDPSCKAHPATQGWGISVISSGEFPVIGRRGLEVRRQGVRQSANGNDVWDARDFSDR